MPLITFVALIQLMDNFRVFEPIVGFNAEAHAQSLSWIIFNDLGGETRQLSAAATSSVLTIIGVLFCCHLYCGALGRILRGKCDEQHRNRYPVHLKALIYGFIAYGS